MAVLTTSRWSVNPGQQQTCLALLSRAKCIHQRLGAKVRIWSDAEIVSYSVEYPNMEAFGRFMNALMTDSEWLRLGESALARDFSARLLGQSLDTEVAV